MNAAQEYLLREATRAAQDALARAQALNPAARVALLEESLTAASVALAAIEKLEHMKRGRSGD